jgi:hypothetical protein
MTTKTNTPQMYGREVLQNALESTLNYRQNYNISDDETSDIFFSNRMSVEILTHVCEEFEERYKGIKANKVFCANPGSFGEHWNQVPEKLNFGVSKGEEDRAHKNYGIGFKTVLHDHEIVTIITKYKNDNIYYAFSLMKDEKGAITVDYHVEVDNTSEIKKLLPPSITECDEFTCTIGHGKDVEWDADDVDNIYTWNRKSSNHKDGATKSHLYFKDRFYEIPANINIWMDRVSKSDSKEPYQLFETWPQLYNKLDNEIGFKRETVKLPNGVEIRYILNSKERRKDAGVSHISPTGINCSGFGTLTSKFIWKGKHARFYEGYNPISITNVSRTFSDLGIFGSASSLVIEVILPEDQCSIELNRLILMHNSSYKETISMGDFMSDIVNYAPQWFKEEIDWHNERAYKSNAVSKDEQEMLNNIVNQFQNAKHEQEALGNKKIFDPNIKNGNVGRGSVKDNSYQPLLDLDNENKSNRNKKVKTKKGISYNNFRFFKVNKDNDLAEAFKESKEHTTMGGMSDAAIKNIVMIVDSPPVEEAFNQFMNHVDAIKLCQIDINYKPYLKEQFLLTCQRNLMYTVVQTYTTWSKHISNVWHNFHRPQSHTDSILGMILGQYQNIIKDAKKHYKDTGGTKFSGEEV